jgi:MFS family permease
LADSKTVNQKRSLPVLFSVILIDLIGFGMVMPTLAFYVKSFGEGAIVAGLLIAVYPALQFLCSPSWGRLSDRMGRRPVMLVTIAGTAVSLYVVASADSLLGLFIGRMFGGFFAANIGVATAYVADVTEEHERTRWMGMVGACFGVGFLLGPVIGGLLAPNLDGSWPAAVVFGPTIAAWAKPFGFGIPMLFAAAMSVVNLIFAFWTLKEPVRHLAREQGASRKEVLRDPQVRRLCAINLIFTVAVSQLETMFQFFMHDKFQYEMIQIFPILAGMALIMIAIQGGAIRSLAARFGERKLTLMGFPMMAGALLVFPFVPSVGLLLIPLAVCAVGRGIGQPPLVSLVSMQATPSTRGSVMGTFQSSASLGRVFGPVIAGVLYQISNAGPFVLASGLLIAAVIVTTGLPKTKHTD